MTPFPDGRPGQCAVCVVPVIKVLQELNWWRFEYLACFSGNYGRKGGTAGKPRLIFIVEVDGKHLN
jgi:hypothetical protein